MQTDPRNIAFPDSIVNMVRNNIRALALSGSFCVVLEYRNFCIKCRNFYIYIYIY